MRRTPHGHGFPFMSVAGGVNSFQSPPVDDCKYRVKERGGEVRKGGRSEGEKEREEEIPLSKVMTDCLERMRAEVSFTTLAM